MALDPQAAAVLDALAEIGFELSTDLDVATLRAAMSESRLPADPVPVARVEELTIAGADGPIGGRLYHPAPPAQVPGVVFFHGGGWVLGDLDTHDATVRNLAARSGMAFVSVDYRRAPEHRFPAAAEDAHAALQWVHDQASALGIDAGRLAVAGDSAGGNLATVATIMARDRGGPGVAFQLLVYPCCDMNPSAWPSMRENAEGYFLTTEVMQWFYDLYMGDHDRTHMHAAPLHAPDLSGLPPALVMTAELDPLRDEGEAYAARLAESGGEVECIRYEGVFHGFFGMDALIDRATEAQRVAVEALQRVWDPS